MATSFDIEFRNFILPSIEKFKRSRVTRFAKSNNVSNEEVHVHNQIPVWFLVKRFKTQNNIKSRLFKSLTEEQKQLWLNFYEENKHLELMTNEKHKQFHDSNMFNVKNGTWKNINPEVAEVNSSPTTPQHTAANKRVIKKTHESEEDDESQPQPPKLKHDTTPREPSQPPSQPQEEHKRKRVRVKKITN